MTVDGDRIANSSPWSMLPPQDWSELETSRAANELRLWHFFDIFEDEELVNIAQHIHVLKMMKSEILFFEGDSPPGACFVLSGVIKLFSSRLIESRSSPSVDWEEKSYPSPQSSGQYIDGVHPSTKVQSSGSRPDGSGSFSVTTEMPRRHRGDLNTSIGKGQWCGVVASLSATPVSTSAVANSEVTLYCLKPAFMSQLLSNSRVATRTELLATATDAAFLQHVGPFRAYAGSDDVLMRLARVLHKSSHPPHSILCEQVRSSRQRESPGGQAAARSSASVRSCSWDALACTR